MIDVVGTVATSAPIETPALINRANAELPAIGSSISLRVLDPLAGILGDFPAALEVGS